MFFKVKQDCILKFNDIGKLHYIGIRIIRSLYQKRFIVKKRDFYNTNPLFKSTNSSVPLKTLNNLFEKEETKKYTEDDYLILDKAISELLSDPDKSTAITIFLQVNETSVSEIHRNSGISRPYLTKQYNKAKEELINHFQNERINTAH